jgi:hypothetical protein
MRTRLTLTFAALVVASCAETVGAINPRPNVELAHREQRLGLALGPTVLDRFTVGEPPGALEVTQWHETLRRGFRHAFDGAFRLTGGKDPADLTLVLVEMMPEYGYLAPRGAFVQVRYKVRLLDRQGQVVRGTAGTADSKRAGMRYQTPELVASALESMYEQIAQEFFAAGPTSAPAPAAPAAQ